MPTVNITPAAGADDGYDSGGYNNSFPFIRVGSISGTGTNMAVRFPSTTIPQGATISTAKITFYGYEDFSGSPNNCNTLVYFEDADSPGQIADATDLNGRSLSSGVAWNTTASVSFGVAYDTPELSSILQTPVNRGSFGGTVMSIVKNNGSSTNAWRGYCSYNYGSNLQNLNVTYTTGGAGQPSSKRFGGVPFTAQGGNVLGTVRRW